MLTIADTHHSPVYSKTPKTPGKVFLKAALFDIVSPPAAEVFINRQYKWVLNKEKSKRDIKAKVESIYWSEKIYLALS